MWIFYRIKNTFWNIYRAIKFGFQRMFRGYDDSDVLEFFNNFTERNYNILNKFICKNNVHPYNLTKEEWDNILQEMCKHLYMMDEGNVTNFLKTGMPEGWEPAIDSVYEVMERNKNEFFGLMKKHFYDLWILNTK